MSGARYAESLPATPVPGATEHHPEAGINAYDSIRFFRGAVGTPSDMNVSTVRFPEFFVEGL
jgi:hypothetical protein